MLSSRATAGPESSKPFLLGSPRDDGGGQGSGAAPRTGARDTVVGRESTPTAALAVVRDAAFTCSLLVAGIPAEGTQGLRGRPLTPLPGRLAETQGMCEASVASGLLERSVGSWSLSREQARAARLGPPGSAWPPPSSLCCWQAGWLAGRQEEGADVRAGS